MTRPDPWLPLAGQQWPEPVNTHDPWDGVDDEQLTSPVIAYVYHGPDGDQILDPRLVDIIRIAGSTT